MRKKQILNKTMFHERGRNQESEIIMNIKKSKIRNYYEQHQTTQFGQ